MSYAQRERDGDLLGRASGGDGHEEHDGDRRGAALAHEVHSGGGGHESCASLIGGDGKVESDGGETHGGGEGEGDGEPHEAAEKVTLGGGRGLGRDGGLPVGLVDEDGTEVTDNVDNSEDDAALGEHGEVGTTAVVVDGAAGLALVGQDTGGAVAVLGSHSLKRIVDVARGAEGLLAGGVHEKDEGEEDDEDDRGVDVGRHEGRLEATCHGVRDDTDGDEETRGGLVHAGERVDSSGAAEDEHGGDDDVGEEAEVDEHLVRGRTPASVDDLAHGVRGGGVALHLDGEDAEEEHLDGGAGGIPEGTGDAVLEGDVGGLKESRRPGPLGDDDRGGQAGLDGAASGVEELGRDVGANIALVKVHLRATGEKIEASSVSVRRLQRAFLDPRVLNQSIHVFLMGLDERKATENFEIAISRRLFFHTIGRRVAGTWGYRSLVYRKWGGEGVPGWW